MPTSDQLQQHVSSQQNSLPCGMLQVIDCGTLADVRRPTAMMLLEGCESDHAVSQMILLGGLLMTPLSDQVIQPEGGAPL